MPRKPKPLGTIPNDPPEPVTPENPLVGLETLVLKTWLENSPSLRRQYNRSLANRLDVENAVRLRVEATFQQELELRCDGMTQEQAEEFTRPAMWTPPTWR
jgi:hypothetical protein